MAEDINIGAITEALNNKSDIDLNNLNSKGQEKFDGEWVGIPQEERVFITENLQPSATTKFEFDVSNTIPNDDYCYDIIINAQVVTNGNAVVGNAVALLVGSTIAPCLNLAFAQRTTTTIDGWGNGNGVLPISTDRKLYVLTTGNTYGVIRNLWISAYRRLGKTN